MDSLTQRNHDLVEQLAKLRATLLSSQAAPTTRTTLDTLYDNADFNTAEVDMSQFTRRATDGQTKPQEQSDASHRNPSNGEKDREALTQSKSDPSQQVIQLIIRVIFLVI